MLFASEWAEHTRRAKREVGGLAEYCECKQIGNMRPGVRCGRLVRVPVQVIAHKGDLSPAEMEFLRFPSTPFRGPPSGYWTNHSISDVLVLLQLNFRFPVLWGPRRLTTLYSLLVGNRGGCVAGIGHRVGRQVDVVRGPRRYRPRVPFSVEC